MGRMGLLRVGLCSSIQWATSDPGTQCCIGIGVVLGKIGRGIDSFAYAVTEDMEPGQRRTSQRAELLAALAGVRRSMHAVPKERIIVTDSAYVVRGITEWLPQWKVR